MVQSARSISALCLSSHCHVDLTGDGKLLKDGWAKIHSRDVSTGANGATVVAPKFSDNLTLPPLGFCPPSQRSNLNFPRGYVPGRDVSTGVTGATVVAPKFSDTLTLFQPRAADSAHHWHGRTYIFLVVTSL